MPSGSPVPRAITSQRSEPETLPSISTGVVTADGKRVWLTEKEYCIFELLSLRQSVTVSKEILHRHLYGEKDGPRSRIIDVFVCHLRKKLTQATGGKGYIETVRGRGYRMRDPGQ